MAYANPVAKSLGPFAACTSNQVVNKTHATYPAVRLTISAQAIAYFELTKPAASGIGLYHESLIRESIDQSIGDLGQIRGQVPLKEFAVEVMVRKTLPCKRLMFMLMVSDGQITTVDCSPCHRICACADKPEAFIFTSGHCE